MDMVWILSVCLVLILMIIPTGGTVSMCKNDTYIATSFQLSRLNTEPTNCTCLLTNTEQTRTQVYFNMTSSSGCGYKLTIYFNGKMPPLSCDLSNSTFTDITSETIKLNYEPYRQVKTAPFSFNLNISSEPEFSYFHIMTFCYYEEDMEMDIIVLDQQVLAFGDRCLRDART
ncbi:hypothetical protein LOTGIDRAFT_169901 [Lottia gigantea]|uniref:CUB domain-containing protein n=1 Tax=Lottia gigantea TaxID=225164 RepID=V3ZJN1_LOTGI|nr:hypothetical protein LOTGIDRAFT_169901 [Lottia gigantea]ESO82580.1 hypothetical protein LOTGIDRAFT_169901 [Lottia gigantea]